LAGAGKHKVRRFDKRAQMCDGFSFETTRAGLAKLEERVFSNESNPVIIYYVGNPLRRMVNRKLL